MVCAENPINFPSPMVQVLLSGTKTQTRQIMKYQPEIVPGSAIWYPHPESRKGLSYGNLDHFKRGCPKDFSPFGQPGDRLWVREIFWIMGDDPRTVEYHATSASKLPKWKPSSQMPQWASRITLEITRVRVEQLHEITLADTIAEGITNTCNLMCMKTSADAQMKAYRDSWNLMYAAKDIGWEKNPWVWVVDFKRITP